ncbi:MAG: preprotein translocase subunit YajC [Planctomycetota bacterium]
MTFDGWFGIIMQAETGGGGGAAPSGFNFFELLPLFVILYLVMYFLMIRPQRKQQKQHEAMLASLKKNDEVRTSGGIFGKVVTVDKDRDQVTLKVDDQNNVRLRVARSAVVAVLDRKPESTEA